MNIQWSRLISVVKSRTYDTGSHGKCYCVMRKIKDLCSLPGYDIALLNSTKQHGITFLITTRQRPVSEVPYTQLSTHYACRLKLFKVFRVAEIANSLANYQWINPSFSHRAMKRGANQVLWHEGVTSLAHLMLLSWRQRNVWTKRHKVMKEK
jgi:hypothetical protein